MAVFYNSSAILNTASVTNLTASALSATAVITGTIQSAQTAPIIITANSTSATTQYATFVLSNTNGVSFGVSTAASIGTITATNVAAIVVSAGGIQATISTLIFSNTNNVSFGLSTAAASPGTGTLTARIAGNTLSYFNYPAGPISNGTTITLLKGSTNIVQQFNLPYAISFNCIRMPALMTVATGTLTQSSTTYAISTSGPGSYRQTLNVYAQLYTLGTGTQSTGLFLANAYSYASQMDWKFQWNNSTSNTYSFQISYGINNTTSSTEFTYSSNLSSFAYITTQLTGFTGNKFLDIVVTNGASLSEGPYWLAYQVSLSTATVGVFSAAGVLGFISDGMLSFANFVNTQYASGFSPMNVASTALGVGRGFWTTNAVGATSATLQLSNIRTNASNVEIPFEMINRV
jgi:hypothetical protein